MHFIRHGQSHFNLHINRTGEDPGIRDAGLTDEGFEQARGAARQLVGKGIQQIIVSPYTRALQTASVIADELKVPMHVEPLVGELGHYSCDIGTPVSELRKAWAHLDFAHMTEEKWWVEKETEENLVRRVDAFKTKWEDRLKNGDYALVSHWYFLNYLTGQNFKNCQILYKKLF